jgi:hypothetical protein
VNANVRLHGYARIMVGSGVTAGTYTLSMRATSVNDATAPIAQSEIKFQIDVVTTETPPTVEVAATTAHEAAPAFVSWNASGVYYIGCAYTQDTRYGERIYYKQSADGGATWTNPVVVNTASWGPGYVTICKGAGTYANRLMIAWNAWDPTDELTTAAEIQIAYQDWTAGGQGAWTQVSAFTNGQGRSTGNTYRTVNVAYHLPTNAFVLVVEIFGYDGTDLTTAAMNDVSCGYKVSTNGGGTWGTLGYVDTNGANLYYFFPSVGTLPNGNLFVYFYERDAGDAAQDRDASFREYGTAGTWGTYYISWDTTDNLMMPQSLATTQGANRNRRVGVYLKGANTDGDRSMYLHWSDDGATWQTNGGAGYGPYGPVMSDHDYGTRFVFSTAYQSGYTWIFGHRKVTYDPYGQPNLLAVYDTDFTAAPVPSVDYLTLDSFIHGKQDAVNTTQGGMAKVFIAQNVFTKDVGHDIVGMYVYSGWAAAADVWGPVTEYLSADKTICNAGDVVTIVANVHDWTTGGSNIQSARYYTDVSATLVTMQTFDGSFNSPAEAVVSTTTPISTSGWSTGWHTIYVAGQDAAGNWGAYESIQIYVNAPATPYATATGPTGTSNDQTPDVTYSYGNGPTTVTMYYTTNGGTSWSAGVADATIDGTYTFATLAAGTYHWNARANGEAAPSGAASIEAGPYVIDLTAPNAPTGLTVQHYGMVSSATTHTYTYSGVTAAGGPHDAYFDDLDDQTQAELTTPNSRLELTDGQYSNIVLSDNTYGGIATDSGLNDEYGINTSIRYPRTQQRYRP